jgi:predicted DNA-binding transcriptional regulator YafY
MKRLRYLSDAVAKAVEAATAKPDRKGWRKITIPIESVDHAATELLRIGAECEVLAPPELRARMAQNAAAMAAIYR